MVLVTEAQVELQAIILFKEIGSQYLCGSKIVEREDARSVILKGRLEAALQRLNPDIPDVCACPVAGPRHSCAGFVQQAGSQLDDQRGSGGV